MERRDFLRKMATLSAALPLASPSAHSEPGGTGAARSIIIDALAFLNNPHTARDEGATSSPAMEVHSNALLDARDSGLSAINTTLGHVFDTGDKNPFEYTVQSIAAYDVMIRAYQDNLVKVFSAGDIRSAHRRGKLGIIYGFQNTEMLGSSAERVKLFADLGVRVIQLTYNRRNRVGDGCMEVDNRGLSEFGRDVVAELNANKVLVDLSHGSERLTIDAIEQSSLPVAITHTACAALAAHPRNKTDAELTRLADGGGVAGIYFMPYLTPGRQPTAEDLVAHIEHAINICGEDHVGIGTDGQISAVNNLEAFREKLRAEVEQRRRSGIGAPGETADIVPFIPELMAPNRYASLAAILEARGHSANRIEKLLGGNFLRLMDEVWEA